MKNFVLPGFYEVENANKAIIFLKEQYPEYFLNDVNFECFYGTFHFCAWGGGRIFSNYPRAYKEDIERIRDFYNDKNYPIRLIFTNSLIDEEQCKDPYCNQILHLLNNGINEVMVNSSVLEDYIREYYPSYKICSSTTKCLTNIENVKKELNNLNYHQVCLDYNLNKNSKFLDSLTQEEKNKCEFLCNAICPPGCPNRKEHYKLNSLSFINGGTHFNIDCKIDGCTMDEKVWNYHNNLSPEDIEEYSKNGFSHFKLEGRTLNISELLSNYIRYLVKPECYLQASFRLFQYVYG